MATAGLGCIAWWGYSPALDLINLTGFDSAVKLKREHHFKQADTVNILLIGAADLRHVLLTIANNNLLYQHIHFYIIESNLEVLGRHMLFLSLIMEPPDQLGYQEKAELFMELYGNILMNSHALEYLKNKSNDLIRFVTDDSLLKQSIPMLDISSLKFKEKDFLEGIFKFWRNSNDLTIDMRRMWENRIRAYLGVRYDHRSGVFDWDYTMKILDLTTTVSRQEYCEWRDSGVAFKSRPDAPYESPNRTLASGIVVTKNGERVGQRGYWGDIVNSPYVTYGTETDNKELLKVTEHQQHTKACQDIVVHNVSSLITKLCGEKISSSVKSLCSDGPITKDENSTDITDKTKDAIPAFYKLSETCTISLLPLGSASEIGKKKKFSNFFDVVYYSNSMVHILTTELHPVFAPFCSVIVESAKYMIDLQKESKTEYIKKVAAMASKIGLKPLSTASETNETFSYLHFINRS